ncbi:aminotransferase [Herbiconiux sp. VKM Ac-1786]|uniref:aminotransferase n=1 Tax=Herbiconiux sp. VKM Ac-1786 TaxID=2783824 RepID=UPI00188C2410|nr:aminotransferase [Herbiconiux sp. VKM Ac-1786]
MADTLFDYFSTPELPTPTLGIEEAEQLTRSVFGLDARLEALGSQQDQNFVVRAVADGAPLGILKISNPVFSEAEIELQTLAAAVVAEREPSLRIPVIVEGRDGPLEAWWSTTEGRVHARVIEFMAGSTLTGSGYLSPRVAERLGELAGRVSRALAGFAHPAAARTLQWDSQHAERVIDLLLADEPDEGIRSFVERAVAPARALVAAVGNRLPRQLGHFDLTDDNVLRPEGGALPDAVIDFGDVIESWAVGEIAVTVSSLLHHDGATALSALPAIRAFHALRPLSDDELAALWPLVVLRGAVLVLSGRQQVRLDAANDYASGALEREFEILERAVSVPCGVMEAVIRDALGVATAVEPPVWAAGAVLSVGGDGGGRGGGTGDDPEPAGGRGPAVLLDASTTAPLNDDGAWLDAGTLDDAALRLLDGGAGLVLLPGLRPVLTGAPRRTPGSPATVPTSSRLWLARAAAVTPPHGVELLEEPDGVGLRHGGTVLRFRLASAAPAGRAFELPARTPVEVSLTTVGAPDAPPQIEAALLPGWRTLLGDPSPALGVTETLPPPARDLLARRDRVLADVQEHYYADPPQIERGWKEYLADTDGRVYLDMVNNVASVGHAHPRIADAVGRQLRLLNTNSRFNYAAVAEYAERIVGLLPEGLDTVFFVNSGSEATDLALRLALASTGRRDVVAMTEAYHGWTYASDAVSTSIADNPNALASRPDWVHTVAAANSYRGEHRGAEAARYAPAAAARIRALAASGRPPAAFICETYFGNAGGVALPDGYLREVYAAVREVGGLVIADEVQVGFGRLGSWFWGFEQQGVVPDIVAVAKSVGAGHPLGVVVTSRAIAERYRTQGYFFSSTGGSPVSSVTGLTVLDIIEDEGLQENARVVGAHLKSRLRELGERHALIGTVHGDGLYLGVEFVRDRATLEPATAETAGICDRLLELGVIMQPTGDHQNVLKIKPPLCVTAESADYFVDALDRVLTTGW